MGKGSRLRSARSHSCSAAETFLAKPENRRAMKNEINNQLSADAERFYRDEAAVILWTLHAIFGFGAERLKRFFVGYNTEWRKLRDYYEASDSDMAYIAVEQLKRIGVDLEQWEQEVE